MKDENTVAVAVLLAVAFFSIFLFLILIATSDDVTKERCADFGLVVKTTSFDVKSMIIRTKCERGGNMVYFIRLHKDTWSKK